MDYSLIFMKGGRKMLTINVDKIRVERTLRRWTQKELADKAGLSLYSVNKIERDDNLNSNVSIGILDKLAKALEIAPSELLMEIAE